MASRGRGARLKGSNFERTIANFLTAQTEVEFQRGLGQTRRGGSEVPDVYSEKFPDLHFELKRQKRCSIRQAYMQALDDTKNSKVHIIITKDDQEDTLVTMELNQWVQLFNCWLASRK